MRFYRVPATLAFFALAIVLAGIGLAPQAWAQGVSVEDIRAQVFLERSGKLSDNLVGSAKIFENMPDGVNGEPASVMLVTLVFKGAPNTRSSDKLARDLASVKVTQALPKGTKIALNRPYGNFAFGADGLAYRAFMLEEATCAPIEIEVRVGKSRKTSKLDFRCDERPAT